MRSSPAFVVLLLLVLGGSAWASGNADRHRRLNGYQEITDEDRAAARERARNPISKYSETEVPPEYHFPWMQIGFVVLAFAVATPFAWGAYKRSARELKSADAFAATRRRSKPS